MNRADLAAGECLRECGERLSTETRAHLIDWDEVADALRHCVGREVLCGCDAVRAALDALDAWMIAWCEERGEVRRRAFRFHCEALSDALLSGWLRERGAREETIPQVTY